MPEPKRPLKVFLCHASTDKPKVRELYRYLKKRGIQPWFDEEDLVGGQDWQVEIPKALATSDAIIICLTKNSVDKEGYIQKEIKFALDKALEMPEGRIFLIPVKFEECEVPFSLSRYQWVDLTVESGYAKMMKALKFRASQLERSTVEVSKKDEKETPTRPKEDWGVDGLENQEERSKTFFSKAIITEINSIGDGVDSTQPIPDFLLPKALENEIAKTSKEKSNLGNIEKHKTKAVGTTQVDELVRKPSYTKPKPIEIQTAKLKSVAKITYWFGGFIVLVLVIVFLASLNSPLSAFQLDTGNTPTEITYNSGFTETVDNNIETPLALDSMEAPTLFPNELTVGKSLINISNINGLISLFGYNLDETIADWAWSPDSKIIAISEDRNFSNDVPARIHLIDSLTGDLLRIIESNESRISNLIFSPDGSFIVAAGEEKIYVWRVSNGESVYELVGSVTDIVFSPDGEFLASGSYSERNVRLWQMEDGSEVRVINNFYLPVHTLAFSPDGKMLIVAVDNKLYFLNTSDWNLIKLVEHESRAPINCIKFSPDGTLLASGSRSELFAGELRLWRAADGSLVKSTNTQVDCESMAFSSDGNWLAYASGVVVRMWKIGTEDEREFVGHNLIVDSVSFSGDNSILVASASAAGYNTSTLYWNINNGNDARGLGGDVPVFSDDGSLMLFQGNRDSRYISVWGMP